jgi:hypothetical protein
VTQTALLERVVERSVASRQHYPKVYLTFLGRKAFLMAAILDWMLMRQVEANRLGRRAWHYHSIDIVKEFECTEAAVSVARKLFTRLGLIEENGRGGDRTCRLNIRRLDQLMSQAEA